MKLNQNKLSPQYKPFRLTLTLALIASLCACASTEVKDSPKSANHLNKPKFENQMGDALTSPLTDFNLTRTEIPVILIDAHKAPYANKTDTSCEVIFAEIKSLNEVLGPDLDAVRYDKDGRIIEKGAEELGNAALGALRGFTEGVVPFRSWVRRLTGADKHAKEVAAASMAGIIRRAYLKGMSTAKSCVSEVKTEVKAEVKTEVKLEEKAQ